MAPQTPLFLNDTMHPIGPIGMGLMGRGIASNLLQDGQPLTVQALREGRGATRERLKPTLANGDTSGLRFFMRSVPKDLHGDNQMAIDMQADGRVAEAIKNTQKTVCPQGDPQAMLPELIAQRGQQQKT